MASFRIGSLDEKQSRFVLIAGGVTVLIVAALVLWNRLHGGNTATAATATTAASSSQTPATLQGVTELYYAPGNLSSSSAPPVATPPFPRPILPPRTVNPPPINSPDINHFGPVPQPTPAPAVATPPPPTRAPAPAPQERTFVVKPWPQPGSSLWTISQIEYGVANWANVNKIAAANHIANPDVIQPGQVLVIP